MMAKAETQAATARLGANQGDERGARGVQPHALEPQIPKKPRET